LNKQLGFLTPFIEPDFNGRHQARIGDAHRLVSPDGETLATWSQPSSRSRVDWQRLRREHPGLIDSYETDETTTTRSFRLRRDRR